VKLTLEDLGELKDRVFGVAERIDIDPEEIEQDIADAIEALKDYKVGEGIPIIEVHERMRKEGKL